MRKLLLEIRKIIKIKKLRRQLGKQLRIRNKESYSWKLYFLLFLFIIFTLGYFNTAILIIFVNFFHQKSSLCLVFFTIFCYSFFKNFEFFNFTWTVFGKPAKLRYFQTLE
jgi:hypothetical protein